MSAASLPTNLLIVGTDRSHYDNVIGALPTLEPYWNVTFATGAGQADAILADDDTIDAVIVQAALPGMTGTAYLERVRSDYSHLARILIADAASRGNSIDALVHQTIEHPLDVMRLIVAVEEATALQQRVTDPALQKLLGNIDVLPSPPDSVYTLNAALSRADVEIPEIAKLVEADVATTATLLRVVNSASFGLSNHIGDTKQAIAYLGLSTVRSLINSLGLLKAFGGGDPAMGSAVQDIQTHSLTVGEVARGYLPQRQAGQDAFVAGMMHDVGLLALVSCAPTHYLALSEEVRLGGRSLEACELDVIGTTHGTIGAYVLGLWDFPAWLVEAVSRSHDADNLPEWKLDVTSAVFVAEQMVNAKGGTPSWEGTRIPSDEYLEALGLTAALPG